MFTPKWYDSPPLADLHAELRKGKLAVTTKSPREDSALVLFPKNMDGFLEKFCQLFLRLRGEYRSGFQKETEETKETKEKIKRVFWDLLNDAKSLLEKHYKIYIESDSGINNDILKAELTTTLNESRFFKRMTDSSEAIKFFTELPHCIIFYIFSYLLGSGRWVRRRSNLSDVKIRSTKETISKWFNNDVGRDDYQVLRGFNFPFTSDIKGESSNAMPVDEAFNTSLVNVMKSVVEVVRLEIDQAIGEPSNSGKPTLERYEEEAQTESSENSTSIQEAPTKGAGLDLEANCVSEEGHGRRQYSEELQILMEVGEDVLCPPKVSSSPKKVEPLVGQGEGSKLFYTDAMPFERMMVQPVMSKAEVQYFDLMVEPKNIVRGGEAPKSIVRGGGARKNIVRGKEAAMEIEPWKRKELERATREAEMAEDEFLASLPM